jgi:hypothetical protein
MSFGGIFAASTLGLAAPDHAREQGAFGKILNLGKVCLQFLKTTTKLLKPFASARTGYVPSLIWAIV